MFLHLSHFCRDMLLLRRQKPNLILAMVLLLLAVEFGTLDRRGELLLAIAATQEVVLVSRLPVVVS